MRLTKEMIDYCESQPWDDDLRQDVYVKVLESAETNPVNNAWLSRIYTNLEHDNRKVQDRRREIERDNSDSVIAALGMQGNSADALDILMCNQEFEVKYKEMSSLLRGTLDSLVDDGMSVAELAEVEDVSENVIYQRVWEIKKALTGDLT
jgi:DNA-directed RNA polymerase specialized sigma24 family protein